MANVDKIKAWRMLAVMGLSLMLFACQSIGSHNQNERELAKIRTAMAGQYIAIGKLDDAKRQLDMAIMADGSFAPAYDMMGVLLQVEGSDINLKRADEYFRRSLALDDDAMRTHNNYAVYLMQVDKPSQAIGHFKIAASGLGYEGRTEALENLGFAHERMGDDVLAINAYIKAVELGSHNQQVYKKLMGWYIAQSKMQKAWQVYQRALAVFGESASSLKDERLILMD